MADDSERERQDDDDLDGAERDADDGVEDRDPTSDDAAPDESASGNEPADGGIDADGTDTPDEGGDGADDGTDTTDEDGDGLRKVAEDERPQADQASNPNADEPTGDDPVEPDADPDDESVQADADEAVETDVDEADADAPEAGADEADADADADADEAETEEDAGFAEEMLASDQSAGAPDEPTEVPEETDDIVLDDHGQVIDDPDELTDTAVPEAERSDGGATIEGRPDNLAETAAFEPTGPASDEEMPLADHIEEMVTRLFIVIAIAGVVSLVVLPFSEQVINVLWYHIMPGTDVARPRVYHPLALLITRLKVASLAGVIVALPALVYETYAFMRPGLYPNERRYYLASIPMSLVLAFVGVTFAYFIVLPAIFQYFFYYSEGVTTIAFALSKTFNLILLLMGYLALVFQIPLLVMLAIMMGLTSRRWLADRRLYFWGGFLGVAFLFSPDPTGMAPFIIAATMITLFEGTLLLLRWTGR